MAPFDADDGLEQEQQGMQEEDETRIPWYLREAEAVCAELKDKKSDYFNQIIKISGLSTIWRVAWAQYFGTDPDNPGELASQLIKRVGDEREYTRVRVNEVRSFIKQMIQTVMGSRPAYKAMTNSAEFANLAGIDSIDRAIGHVMKTAYSDRKRRQLLERGMVLGLSFAHSRWDPDGGDDTTEVVQVERKDPTGQPMINPEDGKPLTDDVEVDVKSGEPHIGIGCPWQFFYDVEEEDGLSWVCVMERRSKWELAHRFTDQADALIDMGGQSEDDDIYKTVFQTNLFRTASSNEDMVTLHHFYLSVMPGAEEGRYIGYVEGCDPLWDRSLPLQAKGKLPVSIFAPSLYIGAFLAYADMWDTISIQQIIDNVVSDWASNIRATGRAVISAEKGAGINYEAWSKGIRVVERNPGTAEPNYVLPPKLDNATDFLSYMHRRMESVTQQNAVRRGDPQANIKSGTMAALFNQISIEYLSDAQEAFDGTEKDIANIVLEMLRTKSKGSFMVEVAGESSRPYWEAFSATNLRGVRSVHIETVSPMMRSPAGRFEMYQAISQAPPEKVGAIMRGLNTGDWSGFAETDTACDLRIVRENELLMQGQLMQVAIGDAHHKHVPEHWAKWEELESADPTFLQPAVDDFGQPVIDPQTGQPVMQPVPGKYDQQKRALLEHINGHTEQWQMINPRLAMLLKIPLPPPMPGTPTGDLAMMTGGVGASMPPDQQQQGAGDGQVPDDGSAPPQGQPKQPKPAEPAQPPQEETTHNV